MKIVINDSFGGFSINKTTAKILGLGYREHDYGCICDKPSRTDPKFIELVESGMNCGGDCAKLKIVDIPDEATDWRIEEYDGAESVLYVIDGKIHDSWEANL